MPNHNPAVGSVRYHSYLAMLANFDHSASLRVPQSVRPNAEKFTDIADQFARDCQFVREEMQNNAERYCSTAELKALVKSGDPPDSYFERYLHRPLQMGVFGATDEVCFLLSDTFSVTMRLAALNPAIENCEVGFVPRLEGLKSCYQERIRDLISGLPDAMIERLGTDPTQTKYWPFYEPHQLLDDPTWVQATQKPEGKWRQEGSFPTPLRSTPLCMVTRFKLNNSAMLNHGALLLDAAERAVIGSVQRVCLAYLDGKQKPPRSRVGPSLTAEELLGLKVMLLEPIGADDIILISFCRNYAAAASMACAVRSLTFDALFEYTDNSERLTQALSDSDVHQALFKDARRRAEKDPNWKEPQPDAPAWYAVAKNHLFMSTSSMFCFGHYALESPKKYQIGGFVQAHIRVSIGPGHEADIWSKLAKAHGQQVQKVEESVEDETYGFLPGPHDELLNLTSDQNSRSGFRQGEILTTEQLLLFIDRLFKEVTMNGSEERLSETGFLDVQTSVIARIPDFERVIPRRSPPGLRDRARKRYIKSEMRAVKAIYPGDTKDVTLLPSVSWHQHGHGLDFFHELHEKVSQQLGFVGEDKFIKFQDLLRAIGCPQSLQLPLIRLFQDFLGGLRDPLICDATLTMYESFVAVNQLLRDEIPTYLTYRPEPISRRAAQAELFEPGSAIVEFLDSLQLAFALRFRGELPRGAGRHGAFHFRGGLGKLIAAVDVPLKCGVGFFRRLRYRDPTDDIQSSAKRAEDDVFKQRFAAVTAVGVEPRTVTNFFRFEKAPSNDRATTSAKDYPLYFGRINLDLAYLFRPEQILHSFHEIGHLICEEFAWRDINKFINEYCDKNYWKHPQAGKFLHNHTSEIFTEFLTHLLVFGGDSTLFCRTFAMEFGEIQGSIFNEINYGLAATAKVEQIHQRAAADLFEEMFTAFSVTELIAALPQEYVQAPLCWSGPRPKLRFKSTSTAKALVRFETFFKEFGPYFPEYKVLWPMDKQEQCAEMWSRCKQYITYRYEDPRRPKYLEQIWNVAAECLEVFRKRKNDSHVDRGRLPENMKEFHSLNDAIRICLSEGRTFLGAQWPQGELDPFVILCRLAYQYAQLIYGHIEKDLEIYVVPGLDSAPKEDARRYNHFLIDHTRLPLFCPYPPSRQDRTRWHVAFFRTLWDLSSQLRARRLMSMIQLPSVQKPKT